MISEWIIVTVKVTANQIINDKVDHKHIQCTFQLLQCVNSLQSHNVVHFTLLRPILTILLELHGLN